MIHADATQQRTVERLRTFDAIASELQVARMSRWVTHCAAVHRVVMVKFEIAAASLGRLALNK